MLELFGRGYVLDHCISTLKQLNGEELYKVYTSELLRGIAKSVGCDVKYSYSSLVSRAKQKEETRSSEEIVDTIKHKISKIQGDE